MKMKKLLLTASAALTLAACGNISDVSSDGTTQNPIFPKIEDSIFNSDGSQKGLWVNWDNMRQIEKGMNKDQFYYLLGRPHFHEGFNVKEWDYVFNFRENGVHKVCQYKVLFDKNGDAQDFWWFPNGCNSDKKFTLSGDFLFDFDKDTLTAQGVQTVNELAGKLKGLNPKKVVVEGHTDRLGSAEYNYDLSTRRAVTVAEALHRNGVTAPMELEGFGKEKQVKHCDDRDPNLRECLRPNRRVEIRAEGNDIFNNRAEMVPGREGPAVLYDKNLEEPKARP